MRLLAIISLGTVLQATAFSPASSRQGQRQLAAPSPLRDVISGEDLASSTFDVGQGGVRLAEESAIKILGEVKHKPGNADARALDLLRYTQLTTIEESKMTAALTNSGGKLLCTGKGTELYKNPGESIEEFVQLAPAQAIKDAVSTAASAMDSQTIVVNFLGSEDLILGEVIDATNEMVVDMDIPTKAKVYFNSMSHNSVPAGSCTVTVVSVGGPAEDASGLDKTIASGEVYLSEGVWYTVDEADINTALA